MVPRPACFVSLDKHMIGLMWRRSVALEAFWDLNAVHLKCYKDARLSPSPLPTTHSRRPISAQCTFWTHRKTTAYSCPTNRQHHGTQDHCVVADRNGIHALSTCPCYLHCPQPTRCFPIAADFAARIDLARRHCRPNDAPLDPRRPDLQQILRAKPLRHKRPDTE